MLAERRSCPRSRVHLYFNKYIDGQPYLCEAIELSSSGMLLRRIHEPDLDRVLYGIEIARGASKEPELIWLCGTRIWSCAGFEALGFVAQSDRDLERVNSLIRSCAN